MRIFSDDEKEKLELKYYNEDVHRSAFHLPQFAKKVSTRINYCQTEYIDHPLLLLTSPLAENEIKLMTSV